MSLNWVMLSETERFVRLPNEHIIYTSPPRTTLSLKPPSTYTSNETFAVNSNAGNLYLTNQRVVYLPSHPTEQLQSFTAPLLHFQDSHVSAPFFGPNVWTAVVQPVSGGGIPPSLPVVELKVTFKEGGAFDFHSNFERIKDRLQQAVEQARDRGIAAETSSHVPAARGGPAVDFTNVHLDELPAYDGPNNTAPRQPNPISGDSGNASNGLSTSIPPNHTSRAAPPPGEEAEPSGFEPPTEPPPGYEEVQQQSVAADLEERLRRTSS